MVSQVSKRYIQNAREIFEDKIKRQITELKTSVNEKYPCDEDDKERPEIMDFLKSVLPPEYKVTWQGAQWSCDARRYYANVQICIKTSEFENDNRTMRENKRNEISKLHTDKLSQLKDWEAETWILLAQGKEIPMFDTEIKFEI